MAVRQIQQWLWKRALSGAVNNYVGVKDEVVVDYTGTSPKLRVMNGITPGGDVINVENIVNTKPVITSPLNNAIDIDLTPILTASSSITGTNDVIKFGQWQIATDAAFTDIVIDTGPLADYFTEIDLSMDTDSLAANTQYYARVKHFMASGLITDFSDAITFTTVSTVTKQHSHTIIPASLEAGDDFGYSMDISANGEVMVVGAYLDDDIGTYSGAAYVYRKVNNSWVEEAKLVGSGIIGNTRFGNDVSISGDGNTIAVSAARINSYRGAVYLYKRHLGSWVENTILVAADAANSDYFGQAIDLSNDGTRIAIAAYYDDEVAYNTGSIYMFHENGLAWVQQAKLVVNDPEANDSIGYSITLSSDGNTMIAGTTRKGVAGNYIGAAYVFTWNGLNWVQTQKLTASDGISADYFGFSVAASSNGNVIAVGATGTDDKGKNSGSVYIYKKIVDSWIQTNKIITATNILSDQFGKRVSLSGDGTTMLVSSPYANINGAATGAGFIFKELSGWSHVDTLLANGTVDGDMVGEMAGVISNDGSTVALGSYRANNFSGAVYVFN